MSFSSYSYYTALSGNGTIVLSWTSSLCATSYILTVQNCSSQIGGIPYQFASFQRSYGPNVTRAVVQIPAENNGFCAFVQAVDSVGRVSVQHDDGICSCGGKFLLCTSVN